MQRTNSLYHRKAGHSRDETGDLFDIIVEVTEESNGFAVWTPVVFDASGPIPVEENMGLYLFTPHRETAIEAAVSIVAELKDAEPVGFDGRTPLLLDAYPKEPEEPTAPEHAAEHAI